MKKTLVLALLFAASAALSWAQDAPVAAAKPEGLRAPRVAVVDMQRISNETLLGKAYAAQLDNLKSEIDGEGTKKQTELQKLDAAIKALQEDLQKQSAVLSPEAAEKKQQEIVRKNRERAAYLEDGQQEMQRMREKAQQQAANIESEFQVKIKPFIDQVAREKSIDLLLDSRVVLGAGKEFDITSDVVVKADEAERAARAKAPAGSATPPKPSPAPAAPAPPKPQAKP